ncbi:MAG: TIGR00725 family protein [Candidatus Nanoarchaeia archaeon]
MQIGVMGSAADLNYTPQLERLAREVGALVADEGFVLLYGAEKDYDSLSTAACRGAKKAGGVCVGFTYGKCKTTYDNSADVMVVTGLERGGGREFSLVLSCDGIICLGGGSGTLTEIAIAYQANIPIVVLDGTGGWSEELRERFLDSRERVRVVSAKTPKEAVEKIKKLVQGYTTLYSSSTKATLFMGLIC